MCDVDDEWRQRRYLSEVKTAELYGEGPAPEERSAEPRSIAKRVMEASLGLADEMEAA